MIIEDPEDIKQFNEYLKNPTCTPEGLALLKEADRRVHERMERKETLYKMSMKELRELIHDIPDDVTVMEYFNLSMVF